MYNEYQVMQVQNEQISLIHTIIEYTGVDWPLGGLGFSVSRLKSVVP